MGGRETELDLSVLAQTESIFAFSNGHIGLRANLEEGEPHGLPGTYLNSFYETHPLLHSEPGYGYTDVGQTLVNVTNGKIIRLLVDDEPFDVRYGHLRAHQRILDLRAGVLRRQAEWVSPAEQAVRLSSVRLVSFAQRAVGHHVRGRAAWRSKASGAIRACGKRAAASRRPGRSPRQLWHGPRPCVPSTSPTTTPGSCSSTSTKESGLRMAAAMDHIVEGPPGTQTSAESGEDLGRVTVATELEPGQRLRLVKFLGYGWSSQRSVPAVRDQVEALAAATRSGWEGLLSAQRDYLDDFWEHADVELEGMPSSSRRSASRSSTPCRRVSARRGRRYRPRASPGRATTGTPSGTARRSSCSP